MTAKKNVRFRLLLALVASTAALLASASPAAAASPQWRIDVIANTTAANTDDPATPFADNRVRYHVVIINVGDASADGSSEPIEFTAALPPGLTASAVETINGDLSEGCNGIGSSTLTCQTTSVVTGSAGLGDSSLTFQLEAEVEPTAEGPLSAAFEVSGGGAPSAATVDPLTIAPAAPPFGIAAFDRTDTAGPGGEASTQAGAHPYSDVTAIDFNTTTSPRPTIGDLHPIEPIRDVAVELPPGFLGNPTVAAQCTAADLANSVGLDSEPLCSPASQVGSLVLRFSEGGGFDAYGPLPIFNLTPPPGVAARFGFNALGTVVVLDAHLRGGSDYGVSVRSADIPEGLPSYGTSVTFWGDPADPVHKPERACPGSNAPIFGNPSCESEAEELAFLRNPTACTEAGEGLPTSAHIDSWFHPGALNSDGSPNLSDPLWQSRTIMSHEAPGYPLSPEPSTFPAGYTGPTSWGEELGPEGCGHVPFKPQISVQPTTNQADSPSGLQVDLTMPQEALSQPGAISQSDLKKAVVTLPAGMAVNPSQAGGLGACTSAQIGLLGTEFKDGFPIHFTDEPANCPDFSKIGTLSIDTPLLDHPVNGAVYLAKQADNPFKSLLALYLVAEDPQSGAIIKLPAHVQATEDGQLTTIVDANPQVPFEAVHLSLFGGQRAPLITPPNCGEFSTETKLTPWARPGEEVSVPSSFTLTKGPGGSVCPSHPAAFAPKLDAGAQNPLAGATSPFTLHLTRGDGEQRFASLDTTPPPGISAYLAGVPYCPEAGLAVARIASLTGSAEQASPSCPAASQVGTVDSGAGAGTEPFHVPGKVYLAGPYQGAPLSLAVFVPAVAGPFDLGDVMVRAAIDVNPETAQITVKSGQLPTILQGIPLDLRSLDVSIDRPHFTVNPTSCDEMAVNAAVMSTLGATANPSTRFQVLGCDRLAFKPKLTLRLKGKTNRGAHPAIRAVLTMPPSNQANIARAQVTLPHAEFLDQGHIRNVCTQVQFKGGGCPSSSILGYARAFSPLLEKPLEGPVYLMSGFGHKLPDLAADLNGQIRVLLHGKIDTGPGGGIRNTFEVVPDAPVTKFTLSLKGGARGLIVNSEGLCARPQHATALFDAQNGKVHDLEPRIGTDCGGKARKHHRGGRR